MGSLDVEVVVGGNAENGHLWGVLAPSKVLYFLRKNPQYKPLRKTTKKRMNTQKEALVRLMILMGFRHIGDIAKRGGRGLNFHVTSKVPTSRMGGIWPTSMILKSQVNKVQFLNDRNEGNERRCYARSSHLWPSRSILGQYCWLESTALDNPQQGSAAPDPAPPKPYPSYPLVHSGEGQTSQGYW